MDNNTNTNTNTALPAEVELLDQKIEDAVAKAQETGRTQGFDYGTRSYEVEPNGGWVSSY